ncbi:MAG: NlpC/P60 family protein [[Eubacterium] siraeum]|nr:NlpC/P60 family protein [[Eubacterium] siraeum]
MAEYTNSGLVKYCKTALTKKTVYMWGGLFRQVTDAYIRQLAAMYPRQYPADRQQALRGLIGKGYYGCDCIGLIKSYYFGGMGVENNAKGYDGSKDFGVGGMYNAAKIKGKISTMPKKEGVLVMTSDFGHVGVYAGSNEVIECTLSKFGDGVVKTKLSDRSWAYWCQCPFIADNTGVGTPDGGSSAAAPDSSPKSDSDTNSANTAKKAVNNLYRSLGVAAVRKNPYLKGELAGRCIRGGIYPADELIVPENGGQSWFKHAGQELYSALTDIDGSRLFEFIGNYQKGRARENVNFRESPSLSGKKITLLKKGADLYLTGKRTKADGITWAECAAQQKIGWCDLQWIE